MYQMKNFACAVGIQIVLIIWAVVKSPFPYYCIFTASLLMVLFSIRSLEDKETLLLQTGQFVFSMLFCILATGFLPFLIFVEFRSTKWKRMRILLPSIVFTVLYFSGQKGNVAEGIVQMLCLLALSAAIYGIDILVEQYLDVKSRVAQAVTITAVNEMYQKKLNQELRFTNYLIDKNARLEERENISRNIHNSVGHSVTAAIMTLDAADMIFETRPEQAREKMHIAKERIRDGLESIRHAVRVLDTDNAGIAVADFMKELQEIIRNFVMDTQIKVRADFPKDFEEQQIPHEHTEFLTGALQELLTNGVKHGGANTFVVSFVVDSSHIRLRVSDNGKSDVHTEREGQWMEQGYGLKKIVSYVKRCGGTTYITNDNGWMTEITLPLERRDTYA